MNFQKRSDASKTLISLTKEHIWDKLPGIYHVELGYETHIPQDVRNTLRYIRTKTARYVRYVPDFLIVDRETPNNTYLLEYKSTQRPVYGDLATHITRNVKRDPFPREDIGRCEQDAYDNYMLLGKMGIRVAILYYVAYHERPLLCDFIQNIVEIDRSNGLVGKGRGSRTPIVNFDNRSMQSFPQFLSDTHEISLNTVVPYYRSACRELRKSLPIDYHENDPEKLGKKS